MRLNLKTVSECTAGPPGKRSAASTSLLMQELKGVWFFRNMGQSAGSKILFECCSHLKSTVACAGCPVDITHSVGVVLLGSVQVSNNSLQPLECKEGESFEIIDDARCVALASTMVISLDLKVLRRLKDTEQRERKTQQKRFKKNKHDCSLSDILATLKSMTLLSPLFRGDLREMAAESKVRCCRPGQIIYNEMDHPAYLYCIVSGKVQIQEKSDDPQTRSAFVLQKKNKLSRISLSICQQKDCFGLEEVMRQLRYRAVATSKVQTKLLCIPSEVIRELINSKYNHQLHKNILSLVEAKGQLLYARRHKQLDIPEEEVHQNVGKEISEITRNPYPTTTCLTSKVDRLPFQCYLPQRIFHQSSTSPRFLRPSRDRVSDIGMLELSKNLYKMSRYRSEKKRASEIMASTSAWPFEKTMRQLQYELEDIKDQQTTIMGFLKPAGQSTTTSGSIHSIYSNFRQKTRNLRWLDSQN